jgi:hypothetical protein
MKNWPVCREYMLNEASKDVYQLITADLTQEIIGYIYEPQRIDE